MKEQRWLRQVEKDSESAHDSLKVTHYERASFQSQQGAKKALKASHQSKGLRAALIHSIRGLVLHRSKYEKDSVNSVSPVEVFETVISF